MILIALSFAVHQNAGDPICLARNFKTGDADYYEMRVSPAGRTAPLGNAFTLRVSVEKGPKLRASGPASKYGNLSALATWAPLSSGLPASDVSIVKGFEFLPFALAGNDAPLKPGEMESLKGGSVKMISDKDSVAQIKIWMPMGGGLFLSEDSDVEVATRLINHAKGTIYQQSSRGFEPVRAFTLERLRTKDIVPIPQDDGG